MNVPNHVAIIMDGNGRWAQLRGRPRIFGHIRGSSMVRPVVRECGRLGVKHLTLYAFSSENWGRPAPEVKILMRLLRKYLIRERKTLMANNVRFRAMGALDSLPKEALEALRDTIELTSKNTGLTLTFALSYGSRQEILNAVKALAREAKEGRLSPDSITDETFRAHLQSHELPDPDLIIRTSGEQRLSNFLLWQAAYAEFYFTEKFWPEFTLSELHRAFAVFSARDRRYGLTTRRLASQANPLEKPRDE